MALAQAVPAPAPARRVTRLRAPVLTIGGLALASLALHLRDPHEHGSWGQCPSAAVGIWCPGCGGLRAVNDLTRGQVGAAASSNLLLLCAIPVVAFLLGRWTLDRWRGVTRPDTLALSPLASGLLLGTVAVFTLLRNLPGFGYLAP